MKDYLLKLFPKDPKSADILAEYLIANGHNDSDSTITIDDARKVLTRILAEFETGHWDYLDLAVLTGKLDILGQEIEGYKETKTSQLVEELIDIDWDIEQNEVDPKEYVKKILAKY